MACARGRTVEVGRRVLGLQIAPALEGAERARLHQMNLAIHYQPAAPAAVLVGERADREQPLAAEDFALDDPEQRAAVGEFIGALRHHPGGGDVLGLLALFLLFLPPRLDPVLEVLDRVAADAELEQMERHKPAFSTPNLAGRSSATVFGKLRTPFCE